MNHRIDITRLRSNKIVRACAIAFPLSTFFLIFHMAAYMAQGPASIMGMDFGVFHLVGQLIWEGRLYDAYSFSSLHAIELQIVGNPGIFIPWAYPPQYDFVPALVALVPTTAAYVLFMVATYLGYLLLLRALSREVFPLATLVLFPTFLIEISSGQNGFLTGILVCLFAAGLLRGSSFAGVPLGLMVIKPHLAIGLALFALVKRRYKVLGMAIATVLATSLAATLAFGPGIWGAFLSGAREASSTLAHASFPMDRMTSVFASLVSLGAPRQAALAAQALSALAAAASVLLSHRRGDGYRETLGLACAATLAISPYNYDYDLAIFGVGLALLLPALLPRLTRIEATACFVLYWIAAGTGFAGSIGHRNLEAALYAAANHIPGITLAGPAYLAVLFVAFRALGREPRIQKTP